MGRLGNQGILEPCNSLAFRQTALRVRTYHWSPLFLLQYLGFLLERTGREADGGSIQNLVKELPDTQPPPCGITCKLSVQRKASVGSMDAETEGG